MNTLITHFARLRDAVRAYIDVLTLAGVFTLDSERSKS
jgi:hypothetical protein